MKNHLKNLSARFYPGGWSLPGDELHGEVEDAVDQEVGHDEGEDVGGGVVQHVSLRFCNIYTGLQLKRWANCTWGKAKPEVEYLSNVVGGSEEDENEAHL